MEKTAYIVVMISGGEDDAWPRPLTVVIGNNELANKIAAEVEEIVKPIGQRYHELQMAWLCESDDGGEGPAWQAFHEYDNQGVTIDPYGIVIRNSEAGDRPRIRVTDVSVFEPDDR